VNAEGFALELRGIRKRFGATVALDGASLAVRAGSLHALLGENGAGKTTLLHVAAGLIRPEAGEIHIDGRPVRWRSRAQALAAGISAVHQHFSLVPAMTVAENVSLSTPRLRTRFSARDASRSVRSVAETAGLQVDPDAVVADLSVAAQQRVEIIKAIAHDAPVLILDEPTAVLSPPEASELFQWLRGYVQRGKTVVIITHRIRDAMQHADTVTVLRSGRTTLATPMRDTDETAVLSAVLGELPGRSVPADEVNLLTARVDARPPVLVLRDVVVVDAAGTTRLSRTSLSVHAGEVVGVAGVEGSGQHDLLRVLAGRRAPSSGSADLPAVIGFVPEDRLRDAVIPGLPLVENLALRGAGTRRGIISWPDLSSETRASMLAFDVRAADEQASASSLSGGNLQKFILARELSGMPQAVVAENPTRGLDVRAARDVIQRIRASGLAGAAVVMYSSDLEELLSVADRMLVCFGSVVREVPLDADRIGRAMVGAA